MFTNKRPRFNQLYRAVRSIAVMVSALFFAIVALNWCYSFYPRNMTNIRDPIGDLNRAFTEVGGFTDISVHLFASDWPWTFRSPAYLGDFYWPEIQKSSAAFWSADGSIIAFQTHGIEDDFPMFRSAYDYRKHELIKPDLIARGSVECHSHILALLESRGGTGQQEMRLGDFKGDPDPGGFPLWGWIAPSAFLTGGLMAIKFLRRK